MQAHLSLLALCALGATASAQVDILYTNISTANGLYHDGLVLWTAGGQRPFVQENTVRGSSGSARKIVYRVINRKKYVYWLNAFPSNAVYRGVDGNGNGVLDASETEELFNFSAAPLNGDISGGHLAEHNGVWAVGTSRTNNVASGVWSMRDMNGDGDFKDTVNGRNEANQLVKGPSIKVGAVTYSSDDVRAVDIMSNGDIIWHEDDADVWFRTTPRGVTSLFLVYKTARVLAGTAPKANADWGTSLPALGGSLDRVAVDGATDTVYLTINFRSSEARIFIAKDGNKDGDINDVGEVKMFFDGLAARPAWGPVDDIELFGGALYGSYEIDPANDPGSQFWKLEDKNKNGNASDPGEFSKVGRTAKNDDPTLVGLTVVPAGTFGRSCINADLENNTGILAAGNTVKLTVKDIPASLQNDKTIAIVAFSLTGDAALPLLPTCILGLTFDGVTNALLGAFNGGPFTANTQSIPDVKVPAGTPVGTKLYFVAAFLRTSDGAFRGGTGTGLIISTK